MSLLLSHTAVRKPSCRVLPTLLAASQASLFIPPPPFLPRCVRRVSNGCANRSAPAERNHPGPSPSLPAASRLPAARFRSVSFLTSCRTAGFPPPAPQPWPFWGRELKERSGQRHPAAPTRPPPAPLRPRSGPGQAPVPPHSPRCPPQPPAPSPPDSGDFVPAPQNASAAPEGSSPSSGGETPPPPSGPGAPRPSPGSSVSRRRARSRASDRPRRARLPPPHWSVASPRRQLIGLSGCRSPLERPWVPIGWRRRHRAEGSAPPVGI